MNISAINANGTRYTYNGDSTKSHDQLIDPVNFNPINNIVNREINNMTLFITKAEMTFLSKTLIIIIIKIKLIKVKLVLVTVYNYVLTFNFCLTLSKIVIYF